MTKEEIALQLTLSRIDRLCYTKNSTIDPSSENEKFNIALGEQIATIYNTIYKNINTDTTTNVQSF